MFKFLKALYQRVKSWFSSLWAKFFGAPNEENDYTADTQSEPSVPAEISQGSDVQDEEENTYSVSVSPYVDAQGNQCLVITREEYFSFKQGRRTARGHSTHGMCPKIANLIQGAQDEGLEMEAYLRSRYRFVGESTTPAVLDELVEKMLVFIQPPHTETATVVDDDSQAAVAVRP